MSESWWMISGIGKSRPLLFEHVCLRTRAEVPDRAGAGTAGFVVRLFVIRWFPRRCAAGLQRLHHLKPRSSREVANFATLCLRTASL